MNNKETMGRMMEVAARCAEQAKRAKEEQADIVIAEAKKVCHTYGEVIDLLGHLYRTMPERERLETEKLIRKACQRVRQEQDRLPVTNGLVHED